VFFDARQPPFSANEPVVVKIGGSLTRQPEILKAVLGIVDRAPQPIVAVAGGGSFADAVREAQRKFGFSHDTAHRMAILAMHQNALVMASVAGSLVPQESVSEVGAALASGNKAIWLPLKDCENDSDLPATWDTTSDAIAARLGERLGGLPVVFVKSRQPETGNRDAQSLAAEGLIDPVSALILERAGMAFTIVEAAQGAELAGLLGLPADVDADRLA